MRDGETESALGAGPAAPRPSPVMMLVDDEEDIPESLTGLSAARRT